MKNLITIMIMLVAVGCGRTKAEKLEAEKLADDLARMAHQSMGRTDVEKLEAENKRLEEKLEAENKRLEAELKEKQRKSDAAAKNKKLKEDLLKFSVVGSYENRDKRIVKLVLFENGKSETWINGVMKEELTWEIVGKEFHLDNEGSIGVCKIEPNGDLTFVAKIKDGNREEAPKEKQTTMKKLKD